MKKLLYIIDKPNLYGSEKHVLDLIEKLKNVYLISLVSFDTGPMLPLVRKNNVAVKVFKMKWYPTFEIIKFAKFIKAGKYDIIHSHQPKAAFWASTISFFLTSRSIVTIHSLPSNNSQSYNNFIRKWSVRFFHELIKFVSELFADRIVYVSHFSQKTSFFRKKTLVIPNWINNNLQKNETKKYFKYPIRFVSVGSVTYNKGMDRMLSALSLIKEQPWTLKIVGHCNQSFSTTLSLLSDQLGISSKIEYMGYLDDPCDLLLMSDCFILLSRGETFGLSYVEAMNCGLPVISWNIPITKEIIPNGNVILDQESDILNIFNMFYFSQHKYELVSKNNKKFVEENFGWESVHKKYLELYD